MIRFDGYLGSGKLAKVSLFHISYVTQLMEMGERYMRPRYLVITTLTVLAVLFVASFY